MRYELEYTNSLGWISGNPYVFWTRKAATAKARKLRADGFTASMTVYKVTGIIWRRRHPIASFPRVDAQRPRDPLAY